jgi:hypothetical protein
MTPEERLEQISDNLEDHYGGNIIGGYVNPEERPDSLRIDYDGRYPTGIVEDAYGTEVEVTGRFRSLYFWRK